jgi:ribonuclease BN (tRNA processing enzyme)
VRAGLELAGFQVQVRIQHRHAAPTVALPFGDLLTYCTDTAYDEANAELARGSRVLAHDASSTEASRGAIGTHSSAREAATVAGRADVEHLVLIHIQPGFSSEALANEARAIFSAVTVGDDLLSMPQCGSADPWVRRL